MSLQDETEQLRSAGYSGDEIKAWQDQHAAQLLNAGFSQQEVQESLGLKDPSTVDIPAVKDMVTNNVEQGKPALSFTDSVKAGLENSVSGLALRGKMPDYRLTGQEPWYSRDASMAAQTVGDVPAMAAGFVAGGGAGSGTGPGALVPAVAGAFALPAALRQTMMDAYTKGDFKNFADFWSRTTQIATETAKGWVTGAATAAGGGAASAVLKTAPALVAGAGKAIAEITAMTGAGSALNGQLPTAQDFVDNAIVMLGMKGAMEGSAALRGLYAKTGVPPDQASAAMKADPTVAQDIAAGVTPEQYRPPAPPLPDEGGGIRTDLTTAPSESAARPDESAAPVPGGGEGAAAAEAAQPPEPKEQTPQQNILSRLSIGESDPEEPVSWNKFYTSVVDKLDPVRRTVEAMKEGDDASALENSYKLMRLLPGAGGKAEQFLEHGAYDFNTLETTGKSLRDILSPVKDDLDGFRAFAASARALELERREVKSGLDLGAATQVVKEGKAKYGQAFKDLQDYQTSTIKYLRDAGILSDKAFDAMRRANKSYVPFYRLFTPEEEEMSADTGSTVINPVKGIEGSGRKIIDPLESVIRNTYSYVQLAERNAAMKSFFDRAGQEEDPLQYFRPGTPAGMETDLLDQKLREYLLTQGIEDVPNDLLKVFHYLRAPLAPDEVGYFADGKYKVARVDPDLAEAFKGVPRSSHGLLFSLLRAPAAMLRLGLVTPEFIIRHLERNQLSASILAEKGNVPFWDTFKGMLSYLGKDQDYQNWLKSGGKLSSATGMDRDAIQDEIARITGENQGRSFLQKAWNVAKTPFDVLHAVQQSLEAATRIGSYKRAVAGLDVTKENIVNAGYYSRNIAPDPARIGRATANWNAVTALFNTEIQHTDQMIAALRDRPLPTLAKIFAGITLPSVLLWAANHDSEEWKEAHQWERDFFWLVPMGGFTLRIPKPFLLGEVFGSGPERLLDKISGADTDNRGLKHFMSDLAEWGVPNFMPTAAGPVLEQITNYSFFKGSRLVPDHLMQMLPEYRYSVYTSELTKELGQIVGKVPYVGASSAASPMVIDNYVYHWTGGLGTYALSLADAALRKAGVLPDPPLPARTLADIPVIKGFVVRYPSATADSIERFQEDYQQKAAVYNTYQALMKLGDADAAMKVMQSNPAAMAKLDGVNKALSQQNALVRLIYKNPDISADEKRQLIDSTYFNMIQMTRQANGLMSELDVTMNK